MDGDGSNSHVLVRPVYGHEHRMDAVQAPEMNVGVAGSEIIIVAILLAILTGERRAQATKKHSG
jgi:hypothetical protein